MSYENLQQAMVSEDPEIRRQTVASCSELSGSEVLEILLAGLGDEDWRVRKESVQALVVRPADPTTVSRLVEALFPGENVGLRNAAVEALGGFGSLTVSTVDRALPQLLSLIHI